MIADIDIWRAAKLLIDRHGNDAPLAAAQRADAMLENGDIEGRTVWLAILRAVEELQRGHTDEPLH